MPQVQFLDGFPEALFGHRLRMQELAARLGQDQSQFAAGEQLARDRMAQDAQFKHADDARADANLAPSPAYLDSYRLAAPPMRADYVEQDPGYAPGEQERMDHFGAAPALVQRDILDNMALQGYRSQQDATRRYGIEAQGERAGERLDIQRQHWDNQDATAAEKLDMTRQQQERKSRGFMALAKAYSKSDPEMAAEYAALAEDAINPTAFAQFSQSAKREARLTKAKPPSFTERRYTQMTTPLLFQTAMDPNAGATVRIDAANEFVTRMPSLSNEDVFEVFKKGDDGLKKAAEAELASRGITVKSAGFLQGLKMEIGEKPPAPQPTNAADEHVVPAKTGAPVGGDGIVNVATPQEAMALPSGTRFRTPDGRVKVRP